MLKLFDSTIRSHGHLVLTSSTDIESSPVDQSPISRIPSQLARHVDPASILVSCTVVFLIVSSVIRPTMTKLDIDFNMPPADIRVTMISGGRSMQFLCPAVEEGVHVRNLTSAPPLHECQLVENEKSRSSSLVVANPTADNDAITEYIKVSQLA